MLTTLRLEENWCQQGMINVSGYSIRKQVEAGKPTTGADPENFSRGVKPYTRLILFDV